MNCNILGFQGKPRQNTIFNLGQRFGGYAALRLKAINFSIVSDLLNSFETLNLSYSKLKNLQFQSPKVN